jgi:hypothetical protein
LPYSVAFTFFSFNLQTTKTKHETLTTETDNSPKLLYHPKMPSQTLLVEIFGPLAIAFVLFVIVSGFRRLLGRSKSLTPAEIAAARDAFRSRLIHPHPTEVEQGIAALLPQRILTLYEDPQTLLIESLEIRRPDAPSDAPSEWIESFLPMDLQSQKLTLDFATHGWDPGFCFATDGHGNFYWVPASQTRQADAPVNFASRDTYGSAHDSFKNERVAPSLDEFLAWPRTAHEES